MLKFQMYWHFKLNTIDATIF